jgi:FtsH-binding integral membrane protein
MSEQNYIKGQRLSKTQYSLLSRSLIVAGVGFGFIALFSWLFYFIYSTTNVSANAVNAMYFISIILIIVVAFMSVSLMAKTMLAPHNVKKTTPFIMFGLYSIAEGIGFGTLFYAIHESAGNSPIHIEDL